MGFMVYINRTRNRACWHRDGCGYIRMHGGDATRANQDWVTCQTLDEVRQVIRKQAAGFKPGDVAPCRQCQPDSPKAATA